MRHLFRSIVVPGMLILAAGCGQTGGGGGDTVPVAGTVTLDSQPLAGATLFFNPSGSTKGHGGSAISGPDGKYAVLSPQGTKGLPTGTYKVTVTLRLRPDGTPPPPDVPPIESDAVETLPARYSSPEQTVLTVTVDSGKPYDFPLQSGKKR
jgi:hypothetical protein